MTGTERARPGRSASLPSRAKVRQVSSAASRTACQSGPPRASPANAPVSTGSASGATGVRSGRRSTQRWSGRLYGGAAPTGSASTALSAPPSLRAGKPYSRRAS